MDYSPFNGQLVKKYVRGGGEYHWIPTERWVSQIRSRAETGEILLDDSTWLDWDDVFDDPELPNFPDEVTTLIFETIGGGMDFSVELESYQSERSDCVTTGSSFEFESDDDVDPEPGTEHHARS
eukprot:scaffold8878_cov74-Cylindrotheca_fusiformis.AAC.1